jgi:transcriptional regulator with XRE-family HTH domain
MDDSRYQRRLAFWLRAARERAGLSQSSVAQEMGYAAASKSSVSDWENGVRIPSLLYLRRLSELYSVPLEVFTEPPRTTDEVIDDLVELASDAGSLAREDWETGRALRPTDAEGRDDERHTP